MILLNIKSEHGGETRCVLRVLDAAVTGGAIENIRKQDVGGIEEVRDIAKVLGAALGVKH